MYALSCKCYNEYSVGLEVKMRIPYRSLRAQYLGSTSTFLLKQMVLMAQVLAFLPNMKDETINETETINAGTGGEN